MKTGITKRMNLHARLCLVAAPLIGAGIAVAQPNDPSGIEFVTIGAVGNAPWPGEFDQYGGPGFTAGRGSVPYEYRIGKTEITTAQWMEYVNTFSTRPGMASFGRPTSWGATTDLTWGGGGQRWRLTSEPGAADIPVFGISRREAAQYCNWLHNGKSSDIATINSGTYDASTFTQNPNGSLNDQVEPSPGARYWLPSVDEWIKAVHYDPNKNGPGQPGWWRFTNRSDDAPPIPGLPGVGQTTAGISFPDGSHQRVPLMSYPDVISPWGLLDTSGGGSEYTSELSENREFFIADGTYAGTSVESMWRTDRLNWRRSATLLSTEVSFRVATLVPAPSTAVVICCATLISQRSRRRIHVIKAYGVHRGIDRLRPCTCKQPDFC